MDVCCLVGWLYYLYLLISSIYYVSNIGQVFFSLPFLFWVLLYTDVLQKREQNRTMWEVRPLGLFISFSVWLFLGIMYTMYLLLFVNCMEAELEKKWLNKKDSISLNEYASNCTPRRKNSVSWTMTVFSSYHLEFDFYFIVCNVFILFRHSCNRNINIKDQICFCTGCDILWYECTLADSFSKLYWL